MPIKGKDAACLVVLMENCVRLSWLGKIFWRVVGDGVARLKIAFNVVKKLMKTLTLLKRSTDIAMLLG